MDLAGTLSLSIKVISDWRVLSATVGVLLLWAVLRYVGSVYRQRRPRGSGQAAVKGPNSASARSRGARASAQSAPAEESDEGMVE